MRITNSMLCDNFMNDMQTNLENMQKLQSQLTSGKEIRVPSDDPFKAARILQINDNLGESEQYNENINDTANWLQATDTSLGELTSSVQRIRELVIASGDAAYGDSELKTIKDEINEKVGEVTQILNASFDGKYLFGGTKASSKPLSVITDTTTGNNQIKFTGDDGKEVAPGSDEYKMISTKMSVEISQGVKMEYNITANQVLNFKNKLGTDKSIPDMLNNILNHLGDKTKRNELVTNDLTDVTDALDNLLKVRAEVGAKQNRMESALNNNENANFNLTKILSKTQDIDFTKKTMEMATARTVYMASLQTSAKIIQPTLMDYLR